MREKSWIHTFLHGGVANVLDFNIVVNEFEIHSHYYVHFWTNILRKAA